MSPKSFSSSGGKGRRTPGKPGRFDPSEPLHMTTRHAARNGRVNSTPSINGSVDGDESGRGSVDDLRPITSYSLSNHHDAKGRRASRTSLQDTPDVDRSFDMLSSGAMQNGRSKSKPISPTLHPLSPSRKRKRSSPTPPHTPDGSLQAIDAAMNMVPDPYGDGYIETVPGSQASDREGSADTSSPRTRYEHDFVGVTQSTEFTPAVSEAVSPASEDSNVDAVSPEKRADVVMDDADQANEPEADDAEDLAEADDADEADDGDDNDDQVRADPDGRPRRRFAGRRRADHPIPEIEAMLRRQLRLKSAFRNISRALKPVLAELAQKTIEDLEGDPYLHERVDEYRGNQEDVGVEQRLNDALAKRRRQLDAQLKWNEIQLEKTHEAERAARISRCDVQIEDARDSHVQELQHAFLTIARRSQISASQLGYETEDEDDDVLPRLKAMSYNCQRKDTLDPKYDSRSRRALETESAIADLQARFEMHRMLQDHDEDLVPHRYDGFTVMNADAAAEFERISSIPVIPNEEAIGLQMLGDLASRPSIRASTGGPNSARYDADAPPSFVPFPPIPHHLQRPSLPYEGPDFGMSPRSQPLSDRFGHHLFHPATPKYHSVPETIPREPRMLSPTFSPSRMNMLPPLAVRAIDDDQIAPPDSPPRYPRPMDRFERVPVRSDMIDPALTNMHYRPDPALQCPPHIDPALYASNHLNRPAAGFSQGISDGPNKINVSDRGLSSRGLRNHSSADELAWEGSALAKSAPMKEAGSPRMPERGRREEQLMENKTETLADLPKSRSRNSSVSQSATDVSPEGSRAGDVQRPSKPKSGQGHGSGRKSRPDKSGFRRVWKSYRVDPKKGSPPPENAPAIHRFRLNSVEQTPQPQQLPPPGQPITAWPPPPRYFYPPTAHDPYGPPPPFYGPPVPFQPPPPQSHPYGYHPPSYSQHQPPHQPPHQPQHQPHHQPPHQAQPHHHHQQQQQQHHHHHHQHQQHQTPHPQQHQHQPQHPHPHPHQHQHQHQHQHRNSFSGPPPNWSQQPSSPLYAVPSASGPPGASPEQWHPQTAPVPPAGPPTPTTAHAQSASGSSYGQPYPGPPIAPATPDHRYAGYGSTPSAVNHPPAFAQQQRQTEGAGHHRRRTQSDAQNPRFQHWAPRPS